MRLAPPDRLTAEEMDYVRPGNSPEVREWNEHFSLLVDEYRTALAEQDEGWVSNTVSEIRKRLDGVNRADCRLRELAQRAQQHGPRWRCGGRSGNIG